jgi:hypothetical protein
MLEHLEECPKKDDDESCVKCKTKSLNVNSYRGHFYCGTCDPAKLAHTEAIVEEEREHRLLKSNKRAMKDIDDDEDDDEEYESSGESDVCAKVNSKPVAKAGRSGAKTKLSLESAVVVVYKEVERKESKMEISMSNRDDDDSDRDSSNLSSSKTAKNSSKGKKKKVEVPKETVSKPKKERKNERRNY